MPVPSSTTSMVLTGEAAIEPREYPVPDVSDGGALLEVETTSVCGSDIGLYRGESHFESLPLVLGHEVAGRIVAGAEETLEQWDLEVGDRVTPEPYIPCWACAECQTGNYHMCEQDQCYGVSISADQPPHLWGGYGEYMYLAPNSRVHSVPDDVSGEAACLSSVIGNGVRWVVTKGDVSPGDSVAVIGPGAQGLASTIVADEAGADPLLVLGVESDADRLELGREFGATHTFFSDRADVEDRVAAVTDGGPEVVIVTAPASPAISLGLELVRRRGRLVLPGLVGESTEIETDQLVIDEISLLGGRGQALNVERAMGILERRATEVASINTHIFPVSAAETAIEQQLPGDSFNPDIVHAALQPE